MLLQNLIIAIKNCNNYFLKSKVCKIYAVIHAEGKGIKNGKIDRYNIMRRMAGQ